MSDTCPVLTDIDIELMGRFRNEIAQIQADTSKLSEECDITEQSGGGKFSKSLAYIITVCIIALSVGATSAFLVTIIPVKWQIYILSVVNKQITLPVCEGWRETALETAGSYIGMTYGCAERARLFYTAIDTISNRIGYAVGAVTGVTSLALQDRVEKYINGLIGENVPAITSVPANTSVPAIKITRSTPYQNTHKRGGRRKSRNGKRKLRKSRKIRRSRKY